LKEVAKNRYHKDEQDITIIPNFVNTDLFFPSSTGKKEQIAFAGRLHWSKGVDTLIDAFRKFSEQNRNWKLVIMGGGEELENLKERAKGIPVDFTGSVSYQKVAEIVNESHIFVLPTKTMEGHPKALIEAMAAGCNCITSNVPGNIDVMRESNMEKYIFNSGNSDDLFDKLAKASSVSPGIQKDFAIDHYSSKKLIAKEIAILNRFLDNS
jgi:glycosyltransferase involved in cell wall biosynthesis